MEHDFSPKPSILQISSACSFKWKISAKHGGKAAGSVSAKTSYLINNDKESTSSKNKKAKELGVSILSEEDFLDLCKKMEAGE